MQKSLFPITWSIPAGTLFATRIRISVYYVLLLILMTRYDASLVLALTGIFLVSTLFHELVGHVLMARSTGGHGSEVLLWPFGGLAWVQPAPDFRSQFLTAAGGPLVNLAICMLIFPALLWIPGGSEAFMPLALPITSLSANWGQDLLVLTFFVNWLLTIINLLPIYPLDGGRMMEACLMGHGTAHDRRSLCLKIGMFAALAIAIGGLLYDNVWIVAFGAWILVLNLMESAQLQQAELYDESFMGYDFSQGYTSLERSSHASAKPVRKSMWQQWQEKRREEKQRQQEQQQQLEAAHLDELLAKVHAQGVQSLTSEERKFLNRASRNYRTRNG